MARGAASGPGRTPDVPGPVLAAGGVLWRPADPVAEVEVALVHRPKYDDWSLPKGKVDPGEHLLETAVREIMEETGHAAVLGRPLRGARYRVRQGDAVRDKQVHYWAARALTGRFEPHAEIDALEWLAPADARVRLTRAEDRPVLDDFAAVPSATVPVIVLRHAQALPRKEWSGADDDRPLSPAGEVQARALPGLLGAYGIRRVVTSPSARCAQTVAAYADKAGVRVEERAELTERGHERSPQAAAGVVADAVAAGVPVVVCSHRPALPTLVEALLGRAEPPGGPLRKGELLVSHWAGGAVRATERHRP